MLQFNLTLTYLVTLVLSMDTNLHSRIILTIMKIKQWVHKMSLKCIHILYTSIDMTEL